MGEFWAPGAEIWLFKKKNMDRSIDLAVQHISITFGNLVGFLTYSSDFDYWPGHVGRPPTGLPPSSFGVKWGKGDEHQFLPALVTKLMDGTFICCSWFIQNWLCPKTFDPPLPPQKCSKLFRQSLREIVQKCCDFSATFSVENLPHLILDKFQKNQFFFTHVLIPSSSVAKIRELYPEEDGKCMGYKRK